jgi:acetyl esterase/lipase
MYANACQLTAISVGYRLAPEEPYPAATDDCFDAAEYLVDHGEQEYGAKLLFVAGESAGSCLAALTTFHLMRSRTTHKLAGLILPFGEFDLTMTLPQVTSFTRPLVINNEALQRFNEAYVPGMSTAERRHASISPLYEDMRALASSSPNKSLPPALFLCGTEDALLDDTLLMSMKWMIAGGEAVVKIYPGAPHGFTTFPSKAAEEAAEVTTQFMQEKLEAVI